MGVTGRDVLRWLSQPHILNNSRALSEALLLEIAEIAEEWLTSAQSSQLADRTASNRVLPWTRTTPPTPPRVSKQARISARICAASFKIQGCRGA